MIIGKNYLKLLKAEIIKRLFLNRKPSYSKKYTFSICGIFKDEAPFLKEWIEFHRLVGVEHFYLYNNNSSDNFLMVLEPYIHNGIVTLIDFPHDHAQFKAYKSFYETYRNESQWISFLDIDEFICPIFYLKLKEWIKPYEKYPVIQIYSKVFGTSGLMCHDYSKLVIEQYHVCWNNLYYFGKCFINTDYDIVSFNPICHHAPTVWMHLLGKRRQIRPVNVFHRSTLGHGEKFFAVNESDPSIQINHYWSKAWDVYEQKRQKTDVYYERNPKEDFCYFLWHENKNNSADFSIYRYLMNLKLIIDSENKQLS